MRVKTTDAKTENRNRVFGLYFTCLYITEMRRKFQNATPRAFYNTYCYCTRPVARIILSYSFVCDGPADGIPKQNTRIARPASGSKIYAPVVGRRPRKSPSFYYAAPRLRNEIFFATIIKIFFKKKKTIVYDIYYISGSAPSRFLVG